MDVELFMHFRDFMVSIQSIKTEGSARVERRRGRGGENYDKVREMGPTAFGTGSHQTDGLISGVGLFFCHFRC